jgi:hypothetical protein
MSGGTMEFRAQVRETRDALRSLFGPERQPLNLDAVITADRVDAPGLYVMSADAYHADPCPEPSLSSSVAHRICAWSPAHARRFHPRLTAQLDDETAEHFDIGTCAHAIVLEGVNNVEVLEYPNWRTKAAQADRDAARANGRIPLLRHVWTDVEAMVKATREQLDAHAAGREMFRGGRSELVLAWQDVCGVWCRARLDYLRPAQRDVDDPGATAAIDDYKTVGTSANPETFSGRKFFENGHDIQAAFYIRGVEALTGHKAIFRFAVQEQYPPFALSVLGLQPSTLMLGEKKVIHALNTWRECLRSGRWPGYPRRTAFVDLPQYVESAWLAKEDREGASDGI